MQRRIVQTLRLSNTWNYWKCSPILWMSRDSSKLEVQSSRTPERRRQWTQNWSVKQWSGSRSKCSGDLMVSKLFVEIQWGATVGLLRPETKGRQCSVYVIRCLIGNQCSWWRRAVALVWKEAWCTMRVVAFCNFWGRLRFRSVVPYTGGCCNNRS